MKVLHLRSLGSLRSAEIEPGINIHPLEFRCAESSIHPLEFRCAESRERLQEERQPGAPCCVSSDDVWRVAVNRYETTRS